VVSLLCLKSSAAPTNSEKLRVTFLLTNQAIQKKADSPLRRGVIDRCSQNFLIHTSFAKMATTVEERVDCHWRGLQSGVVCFKVYDTLCDDSDDTDTTVLDLINDKLGRHSAAGAREEVRDGNGIGKVLEGWYTWVVDALLKLEREKAEKAELQAKVTELEEKLRRVKSDMEEALICTLCFKVPAKDMKVRQCVNGHITCQECLTDSAIAKCPERWACWSHETTWDSDNPGQPARTPRCGYCREPMPAEFNDTPRNIPAEKLNGTYYREFPDNS